MAKKQKLDDYGYDDSRFGKKNCAKDNWMFGTPNRRGSLQDMYKLPLEGIYEVLGYLHPHDLLRMSRTSERLRKMVLNRSTAFLWRRAVSRLGLPERIPSMSEPAYASLLFDRICKCPVTHGDAQRIGWSALMRCCKACSMTKINIINSQALRKYAVPLPQRLLATIPHIVLWPDKDDPTQGKLMVYSVDATRKLHARFKAVSSENREAWVQRELTKAEELRKVVDRCKAWDDARKEEAATDREALFRARRDAIAIELIQLSWEPLV
ncbi:hypothetical protein PQX77_020580 [Marasmius sp. AFHP31]|nr:hypothetical protein PQX77_020580 [Marasmius sp. AFHP31]